VATRWLVDGMNVIGSRPTGWWRDREGAKRDFARELAVLVEEGDEVTVVFDGRELDPPIEAEGVEVRYAPGGPNSADDRIVEIVRADSDPGSLTVVTSDGELERRVRELGARVTGAGQFHQRI
jgi:predicted RNA-binding protein with PIN domain